MTSPFKTHETMDLARALLEEDSKIMKHSAEREAINNNDDYERPKPIIRSGLNDFGSVIVSKESSTELIPTQAEVIASHSGKSPNLPTFMKVRDMNAGNGILDDDGKPVVGKVFSRVMQVSGADNKAKPLKSHHRGRSASSCCRDKNGSCQDKDRSSSVRPQSGNQRTELSSNAKCPRCKRQFSDETVLDHHIVFCTGTSKDLM